MTLLLDTCVALWLFEGSDAIPEHVRLAVTDLSNDVFLSDVSVLEVVIKHKLGKLPLPQPPSRLLLPLARKHLIGILSLSTEAILRLEQLPDLHRDPFDRLLVAQSLTHRMTLVTPDPLIRRYGTPCFWD